MSHLRSILLDIFKNTAMQLPPVKSWRLSRPRTAAIPGSRESDVERFAFMPLRGLLGALGSVHDLHVLEIGPGDHLGTGFSLLAAGAASYTAIDRFPGNYSNPHAKTIYREVQRVWADIFPDLTWPDYLESENFPEAYSDRIKTLSKSIEEAETSNFGRRFDVVCSYQVAEHVSSLSSFAAMNANLLHREGVAVHRIDFGPHYWWDRDPDPYTFLRFPDWLWSLMGSHRGAPNRYRFHELCEAFESTGMKVEVVDRVMLPDDVDRSKLARRFKDMPVDSISTLNATIVARPGNLHQAASASNTGKVI